jgi:hypothetical protein
MKLPIIIAALLAVAAMIIWTVIDLHLSTARRIDDVQRLLNAGTSVEELERAIGTGTHEYSSGSIPEYLKSVEAFEDRKGTVVRVYNQEGLPYWWVVLQIDKADSKIVWHLVAER